MKKLHFGNLFLLAIFVSLTFLGACSKKESADSALKILKYGNGTEPAGLDPHVVTGVPEHHILLALFEGLSSPNPKTLAPEPLVRWRKEYGGMRVSQAKRLKELEAENARLKKIVANQAVDIDILKVAASGNF